MTQGSAMFSGTHLREGEQEEDVSWWRDAVIYQVCIRTSPTGTTDGVGDIAGLRSRLLYLRDLGVDAIWINPWYVSPMADADYRDIDPLFGDLAESEELVAEAHALGLRVIPGRTPPRTGTLGPARHWRPPRVRPERARYIFRPGPGGGRCRAVGQLALALRWPGVDP